MNVPFCWKLTDTSGDEHLIFINNISDIRGYEYKKKTSFIKCVGWNDYIEFDISLEDLWKMLNNKE